MVGHVLGDIASLFFIAFVKKRKEKRDSLMNFLFTLDLSYLKT